MEQPPYIQHSLVISKLPYLPPHAQMRIAIGMYASARLCAPPWECAHASSHGGGRAKSRSLATASRKSRTRLYSYTAIPCLTCSSSVSSSSQPSPSVYQPVYRANPPKRNTHVTQPKLCKSFKNSFLVTRLHGITLPTELRCPKCPYL